MMTSYIFRRFSADFLKISNEFYTVLRFLTIFLFGTNPPKTSFYWKKKFNESTCDSSKC